MTNWQGKIGQEGELSADGRVLQPDSIWWKDLPLPLMMRDTGEQVGSKIAGRIDKVWRTQGGGIWASGVAEDSMLSFLLQNGFRAPCGMDTDSAQMRHDTEVGVLRFDKVRLRAVHVYLDGPGSLWGCFIEDAAA